MKRSFILILLVLPFLAKAQYSNTIQTNATPQYIYVGTLNYLSGDGGNLQKIEVDIFGGGWGSTGMGVTTYYIANRGGLVVNRITTGSSNDNFFTLQAYTNSTNNNIDFYVVTNNWSSFAIKSIVLGSGTTPVNQYTTITSSATVPTGTPLALTINPVMITDATGNIGIGTVNPNGYKFAVKGNIHAQQVNVDLTNWADYVFKKDYQLSSLNDIKTYIDQNHHLPELPSEQEIVKNGVDLGEMNRLLVKKVEELTLYLIEQQDLIKKQQNELGIQNKITESLNERLKLLENKDK